MRVSSLHCFRHGWIAVGVEGKNAFDAARLCVFGMTGGHTGSGTPDRMCCLAGLPRRIEV